MATTTQTRTKAIIAVSVVAAIGLIGLAAAVMFMKSSSAELVVVMSESSDPVPYDESGGTEVAYTIKVTNKGNKKTGPFTFVVSTDNVFDGYKNIDGSKYSNISDDLGREYTYEVINLGPGESVDTKVYRFNSQHNYVPCDGTSTDAHVSVSVDSENIVSEIKEDNNTASETTTLKGTTDCPDLSATITENADPIEEGDGVEYEITVSNNGTDDTNSVLTYSVISSTGSFDGFNGLGSSATCTVQPVTKPTPTQAYICTLELGVGDSDTIKVGNSNNGSSTPPCGKSEENFVEVEIDSNDSENETDETNNTVTETTTFNGPAC